MSQTNLSNFPLKSNPKQFVIPCLGITLIVITLSAGSLISPGLIYPDPGLREDFLTNDLVNLLIGVPYLMAAMLLLSKERMLGLVLLPGSLLYVIYNYFAYALARPLGYLSLVYLGLVFFCVYVLVDYLRNINHILFKEQTKDHVPGKLSGWILLIFGAAFFLLACFQIISGILAGNIPPLADQAVSVADILISSLWIGGGVLLLRENPLGYTSGLGLLSVASLLFIGLILFMIIDPFLTSGSFDLVGVLTVLVMGLLCFIPTNLFWRGVVRSGT